MRWIAAALAGLLLAPAAAADDPTPRLTLLTNWVAAARGHEPGTEDAHAYAVGAWSNPDINLLWLDVQTLVRFTRCTTCGQTSVLPLGSTHHGAVFYRRDELRAVRALADDIRSRPDGANDLLKRAAILHADIAMLLNPESDGAAPPRASGISQHFVVRGLDGRQERIVNQALHWELGRALVGLVGTPRATPAPQEDATVLLWYRATMAFLQREAMHDRLHFSQALQLFPANADVQYQNGCLHETLATPRVQGLLRNATLPTGVVIDIKSDSVELETAERHFRRALELRPAFGEARLRLGRVLGQRGRHADAATELRQLQPFDDLQLDYYAALFLAGEEAALGRRDAAREAYQRAVALFPQAQSALLGLSQVLRDAGDRTGALKSVQQLLDLPAEEDARVDPLWIYHFVQGYDADRLLDELYEPFRQGDRR